MLAPNLPPSAVAPRTGLVGDYRRYRQQSGGAQPAAGTPPIATTASVLPTVDSYRPQALPGFLSAPPAPYLPAAPTPYLPAQAAPTQPGFFKRILDWVKGFFQPAAPSPVAPPYSPPYSPPYTPPAPPYAPPAPPVAPPAPPVTPPLQGPTSGVQAFFTNAYAGTLSGRTSTEVNAANEASAKGDPRNPDKQLAAMIDGIAPGGTLDGAFFDIEAEVVVAALARAAQRGVRVRLVTENDYYVTPDGSALRHPITALKAAGVQIIPDDRRGALMHDKFLIANGRTVWTGSYNITTGGSYRENNNALRIESAELAAEFQKEFDKMYVAGNFGPDTPTNGNPIDDHPAPKTVRIGQTEITTYFSPSLAAQRGAKGALMDELAKAQKSIQFMAFSFTDDDMGQLLLNKARSGVQVQGVFEKSQAASRYSEYQVLNPAEASLNADGVKRLDVRIDTNPALMHHKVMIVDDSTVIMGSFNFSASAQSDNVENMLVIKNAPDLVARYKEEFARVQAVAA